MKHIYTIGLLSITLLFGCQKENSAITPNTAKTSPASPVNAHLSSYMRYSGADYSQAISIDTANRMIQSYLTSINYPDNNTELRSLNFDADTLRAYLNNSNIVTLKFIFSHSKAI